MAGKNVKDNGMCRVAHAWLRGMRPRNGTSVSHGVCHKTRGLIARLSESLLFPPPPSRPPSLPPFIRLCSKPHRESFQRLLSFAFAISPARNVHQILYRILSRRIAFVRYNGKVLRGEQKETKRKTRYERRIFNGRSGRESLTKGMNMLGG